MSPRNILNNMAIAISLVLLAVCCGLFILFTVSGTGWQALSVPTGSMRPSMPPGSLALVHRVPVSSLKIGDIITYVNPLNPKTTISHRIIKTYMINQRIPGFITKGDANKSADVPIAAGSIEGRVVWHVPYVGAWLIGAKSWLVIGIIVYVPALIILADEVRRLAAYYQLSMPYRLHAATRRTSSLKSGSAKSLRLSAAGLSGILIVTAIIFSTSASALFASNTVKLANNRIAAMIQAPPIASCNNNTTITSSSNSSQAATSGNATANSPDSSGSATSGAAANTSSHSTTITIVNGC